MILYHSSDLIWATKIKGTADVLGLAARPVRTLEMLDARLADSPVVGLIVDLDAPETAISLIQRLRPADPTNPERPIRIVAFGPHVAVEQFAAARAAGADTVLARGAFNAHMSRILKDLATGSAVDSITED